MIIDISHWQNPKNINYDKLAKQLDFAIIRTQYGSIGEDRHYKTHHTELKSRGVPTHAYAWVRGVSITDMEKEATDFYNRTKQFNPVVWWLDVEEHSMADMKTGIKAYVNKLRELGATKVGIYIGHTTKQQYGVDLADFDVIWHPRYGINNGKPSYEPASPCDLWQYTDRGRVDGYNYDIDLNKVHSDIDIKYFTEPNHMDRSKSVLAPKQESKPVASEKNNNIYTVKAGDTLSGIAKKHNRTVTELAEHNNIKNPNIIHVGQKIEIPATKQKAPAKVKASTYTVKKGDTLSQIAQDYGATVQELQSLNGIKNANLIRVGQKIKLPTAENKVVTYTVRKGDTVWDIAQKHGTTVKAIESINSLKDSSKIYPGQKLKIK